jgi:uncharacterized protein YgbK (DUF1537 family)
VSATDPPVIGCIADDFTGGTDLGSTLAREGLEVVQTVGVPPDDFDPGPAEAIVVALKSRTAPVADAVRSSLDAARWLRRRGVDTIFFKYCSTFDSRPDGNIGPVADALLDELGEDVTIVCPAFPETGRTVYRGHLFVGDVPLDESSMARHPLTPMTDSSVLRLLGRQVRRPVTLIPYEAVAAGPDAIREALGALRLAGGGYAVVDALDDRHLRSIGEAAADLRLVTGASGVARGIPDALRRRGRLAPSRPRLQLTAPDGPAVVIAGSVSPATREQVERFRPGARSVAIDPVVAAEDPAALDAAIESLTGYLGEAPVLVHGLNDPADVARAQAALGAERSAQVLEGALGRAAAHLVEAGARRMVVAGGETSAAVVEALGIRVFRIGPDIGPGVPWVLTSTEPRLALALKSGNFGGPLFFSEALDALG